MSKWYGKIGFGYTEEVPIGSGVWEENITEREYSGDLLRMSRSIQASMSINDQLNIANQISILADPFAKNNVGHMLYAEFMGTKWRVSNIEVQYPRLILTLGGIYNVEQTGPANETGDSTGNE